MKARHWLQPIVPALSLVALAALIGCSSESERLFTPAQAVVQTDPGFSNYDSAVIGPSGGTLTITGARLEVPAGALASSITISMTRHTDGSIDLAPDGQTFSVSVVLDQAPPPGATSQGSVVQWYDPNASSWVTITSELGGLGRLASLAHFSGYRIISYE